MAVIDAGFADEQAIVLREVAVHLAEIDGRPLRDRADIARSWLEVRRCDDAVLDVLAPAVRSEYLDVVNARQAGGPVGPWRSLLGPEREAAGLRMGVHRRLMVLLDR